MSSYCYWLSGAYILSVKLSVLFSVIVPVIGRSGRAESSFRLTSSEFRCKLCSSNFRPSEETMREKYQRSNRIPLSIQEISLLLPKSAQRLAVNHHSPALRVMIWQMCLILLFVCTLQLFVFKFIKAWIHCTVQMCVKFSNLEFARDFLGLQAQFLLAMYSFVFQHYPQSYQASSGSILT